MHRNHLFDIRVTGPITRKNCHIDTMDVATKNYAVLMDDVCDFSLKSRRSVVMSTLMGLFMILSHCLIYKFGEIRTSKEVVAVRKVYQSLQYIG